MQNCYNFKNGGCDMSDFLDLNLMISYVRECPPESYKLMQVKDKVQASAFENGERVLQPGETNVALVHEITNFYLAAKSPITISLSDGTTFNDMRHFAYGGATPISVVISNPSSHTVKVLYAAGLESK